MKVRKLFLLGVAIALTLAFFDLLSKRLIFAALEKIALEESVKNPEIIIFDFFSIVLVWNRGVSFGMFNQLQSAALILSILQFVIMTAVFYWLYYNQKLHITFALGLIAGGALGNLCDRIKNGAVADFLDFHIASYHWPAFNLADSAVFIGVVILLCDDFIFKKR
ncbi:MAG: signal peptidase II [Rickettsiales bacterium]|nr:signal peptidase II [Rickettsiales bacterium]